MFAISYVTIFALHPELDIDCVIIEGSFGHSRKKLTSLNYLTCKQLYFKDNKTLFELRDPPLNVDVKVSKIEISKMFTAELQYAANSLL